MKNRFAPHIQFILSSQLFLGLRGHWALTAGVVLCLIGQAILTLLQPWPIRAIIDYAVESPTISHEAQSINGILHLFLTRISQFAAFYNVTFLLSQLAILFGIFLLSALLLYFQNLALARLGQQVILSVRGNMFTHLMFLPQKFFDAAHTGDLTSRISKDTADIQDMLEALLTVCIRNIPLVLGILVVSFTMDWVFALTLVLVVPMAYWANARFMQRTREAIRSQMRIEGTLASDVQEAFYNRRTVTTLSLEDEVIGDFLQGGRESAIQGNKAGHLQGMLTASMDALVGITSLIVLLVGALRILHGSLTVGQLTIFIAYVTSLFKPIREIAKFTGRLAKSASALERIEEIMRVKPREEDICLPNAIKAPPLKGNIELEDVAFAYDPDRPILNNFNLRIPAGHKVALVGESGNGKSTILHLIMRLYAPRHGKVRIDGIDIRTMECTSLRNQMSIVLQDSYIFKTSIGENIAIAKPGATELEIIRAAKAAGADAFIRKLPQGYSTQLGEGGIGLSGGQKRRIAIARAILRDAPIILLDEPTAGLDPVSEQKVTEALKPLTKGKTTVVVTHQLSTITDADRILVISGGEIAESGMHQDLLNRNGPYKAMWEAQQVHESGGGIGKTGRLAMGAVEVRRL